MVPALRSSGSSTEEKVITSCAASWRARHAVQFGGRGHDNYGKARRNVMTTKSDASILLNVTDGVGWITFNRPKAYNALNTDMAERLLEAVIRCDEDDKIRAVVITGKGASFCAGGDIRQMIDSGASEGNAALFLKTLTVSLHAAIATIAHMSKPVVMAVNGAAAG